MLCGHTTLRINVMGAAALDRAATASELEAMQAMLQEALDAGAIGLRTPTHLYGMQLEADRRTISDEGQCFYDLIADPYEQHNLAGEGSTIEGDLAARLTKWNTQTPWLAC